MNIRRLFLHSLIGLLSTTETNAQATPALFKILNRDQRNVPIVFMRTDTAFFKTVILTNEPNYLGPITGRTLIKAGGRLLANIDGSGRLYLISDSIGRLWYTRYDSTYYGGATFGSIVFSGDGNIYSLGGYGFWRSNGQLRVYDTVTKSWELVLLNEEIAFRQGTNHFPWIDEFSQNLYLLQYPNDYINQAVKGWQEMTSQKDKPTTRKLNFRNGVWETLGTVKDLPAWTYRPVANLPWGLLLEKGVHEFELLNYKSNQILRLSEGKSMEVKGFLKQIDGLCFSIDSTFYYGDLYKNTCDSLQLSRSDFSPTGASIFEPENHTTSLKTFFAFCVILGFSGLFWYISKVQSRKSKRERQSISKSLDTFSASINAISETVPPLRHGPSEFTEVEKLLLKHLADKSQIGETASIDELNKILGVANKNIPSQKRARSEAIASINQKALQLFGISDELISRQRSTIDGRLVEYYISSEMASKFLEWQKLVERRQ